MQHPCSNEKTHIKLDASSAKLDHLHPLLLLLPWLQLQTDLIDVVSPLVRRFETAHYKVVNGFAPGEVIWLKLILLYITKDLGRQRAFEKVDER